MREETGRHLDYLDGWRGLAVSLVLFGHFWADQHLWSGMSTLGVSLFFVLSGRLMAEILFVHKSPLPTFFLRRFSRVYPALLVYVAIISFAATGTVYQHKPLAAAAALTFTINYAMIYTHPVALLDHLWSLCVEEHAYVILAGVAFLGRRKTFAIGAVIALLGFAALANGIIRTTVLHQGFFFAHWRSDVAVAPIFLASALWLGLRKIQMPGWVSPVALAAAVCFNMLPYDVANFGLSTLLLAVAVTTLDDAVSPFRWALTFPAMRYIGLWSYSLYLWQQPFYKLHRVLPYSVWLLLGAAVLLALLSYYFVERPARAAINHFAGRVAPSPQPAATAL